MAQVTVWYDGGCPLCVREIALMRRLDRGRRVEWVDLGDGESVCPIDRGELLARFHAREGGVMRSGAAAFAAMWRAIPAMRPLGLAARMPGVLPVLEAAYLRFLRVRPGLQRWMRAREARRG